MIPESTPAEVRAWMQSAKLLLRNAEPALADRVYSGRVLIPAADRLRVEDGQCPPVLRRN